VQTYRKPFLATLGLYLYIFFTKRGELMRNDLLTDIIHYTVLLFVSDAKHGYLNSIPNYVFYRRWKITAV